MFATLMLLDIFLFLSANHTSHYTLRNFGLSFRQTQSLRDIRDSIVTFLSLQRYLQKNITKIGLTNYSFRVVRQRETSSGRFCVNRLSSFGWDESTRA